MNTLGRWRSIAARVDLSLLFLPLRIEVLGSYAIAIHCETQDRDGRGDIALCWTWRTVSGTEAAARVSDTGVLGFIREALIGFLVHEADEALVFDGVRVFDPHKDEKAKAA